MDICIIDTIYKLSKYQLSNDLQCTCAVTYTVEMATKVVMFKLTQLISDHVNTSVRHLSEEC